MNEGEEGEEDTDSDDVDDNASFADVDDLDGVLNSPTNFEMALMETRRGGGSPHGAFQAR